MHYLQARSPLYEEVRKKLVLDLLQEGQKILTRRRLQTNVLAARQLPAIRTQLLILYVCLNHLNQNVGKGIMGFWGFGVDCVEVA